MFTSKHSWSKQRQWESCFSKFMCAKYTIQTILCSYNLIALLLVISGDVHPNPGPHENCLSICHTNIRSLNYNKLN